MIERTLVRLIYYFVCAKSVRNRISKLNLKYRTPRNGSFFMTKMSDQFIEDAFLKIRSMFEKRNNNTGLEILDSYEDAWAAYGSLTDRQVAWLKKQLDGSWLSTEQKSAKPIANQAGKSLADNGRAKIEPLMNDPDDLIDAIIQQKLAAQGKVIVDRDLLHALITAIDDLRLAS